MQNRNFFYLMKEFAVEINISLNKHLDLIQRFKVSFQQRHWKLALFLNFFQLVQL